MKKLLLVWAECVWGAVCVCQAGGVRGEVVLYWRAVYVVFVECVEGVC